MLHQDGITVPLSEMIGKIFIKVVSDRESVSFFLPDGSYYCLEHEQNCCESVNLEDVGGDLSDLEGKPILDFREETNRREPQSSDHESYTWTFYIISTIKGTVTLRFYGHSNGYYSEKVDLFYFGPDDGEDIN